MSKKKTTSRPTTDRMGNEIPAQPDPIVLAARAIRDQVRDRDSLVNVLSDLTPAKLVSIFREADEGNVGPQIELAELIEERDPHVQSLLQTRTLAVKAIDFNITAGDESDQAVAAADAFKAVWKRLKVDALMTVLLRALNAQWSIAQVLWETGGKAESRNGGWTPVRFVEVDCRRLFWPWQETAGEDESDSVAYPRIAADWGMLDDGIKITAGSFVAHSFRDRFGRPGRGAPVRSIAFWWLVKRFASIDLATFVEQFGKPWKAVKYDPNASADQIDAVLKVIKTAASDMGIALPKTAELELIDAAKGGEAPHLALIRLCDDQIAKAIIGSTTINDASAKAENVSSPTHAGVRRDIRDADAKALAESITEWLIKPWTLWNYGPSCPVPTLEPVLADKPDPASRANVYEAAGRLGLAVKSEQVYGDLGIEKPDDVPEVIVLGSGGQLSAVSGQQADESRNAETPKTEIDAAADAAADAELAKFKRQVVLAFLADRTTNDTMFNLTKMRELLVQVGIPIEEDYVEPWMPVRDETGALVSGEAIKDSEGDIVGGSVIPGTAPAVPSFAGGNQPAKTEEDLKSEISEGKKKSLTTDDTDNTDAEKSTNSSSVTSVKSVVEKPAVEDEPKGGAQ